MRKGSIVESPSPRHVAVDIHKSPHSCKTRNRIVSFQDAGLRPTSLASHVCIPQYSVYYINSTQCLPSIHSGLLHTTAPSHYQQKEQFGHLNKLPLIQPHLSNRAIRLYILLHRRFCARRQRFSSRTRNRGELDRSLANSSSTFLLANTVCARSHQLYFSIYIWVR